MLYVLPSFFPASFNSCFLLHLLPFFHVTFSPCTYSAMLCISFFLASFNSCFLLHLLPFFHLALILPCCAFPSFLLHSIYVSFLFPPPTFPYKTLFNVPSFFFSSVFPDFFLFFFFSCFIPSFRLPCSLSIFPSFHPRLLPLKPILPSMFPSSFLTSMYPFLPLKSPLLPSLFPFFLPAFHITSFFTAFHLSFFCFLPLMHVVCFLLSCFPQFMFTILLHVSFIFPSFLPSFHVSFLPCMYPSCVLPAIFAYFLEFMFPPFLPCFLWCFLLFFPAMLCISFFPSIHVSSSTVF